MQFEPPLEQGRLLKRYKRFLADIQTASGELLTIHCPNTGSMFNCMQEGGRVWFSRSNDPKRKLPGTLYANISAFGGDAFAFCQHFLETEHVAFTPGLDFGRYQASQHVRFAYTQSVPRLQQAVERIARGLKSWRPHAV